MTKQAATALYVLAMVAIIVVLDVGVLRDRFTARLVTNIAIVLLFGAGYFLFFRRA